MRRLNSLLFAASLAALVSGCGREDVDPQPSENSQRGTTMVRGQTKADGTKSCVGFCGKKAIGCYCDSQCAEYGDCCPDKGDVCDGGGKPPKPPVKSCAGFCGGQSPSGCWCDSQCAKYGDCCDDKAPLCDSPKSDKCTADSDCDKGAFCALKQGECLLKTFAPIEGTCKAIPEVCIKLYAPVCGCDGKTYGNDCEAWSAGTSVASEGACKTTAPKKCGPFLGGQCAAGQVCDVQSCGIGGGGVCKAKPAPQSCNEPFYKQAEPVCGCDGETYGNDCLRLAAGAALDHKGDCGPQTCESIGSQLKCAARKDCQWKTSPGFPGPISYCETKPKEPAKCNTLTKQVCESRSDCQWNSGAGSPGFPPPLGYCSDASKPTFSECSAIDSAYQKALVEAKKCSEFLPTISCDDKAHDSLSCKTCVTFVNIPGVLSKHIDKWNATGCGQLFFACPMYVCPLPKGGSCSNGSCKDL